MLTKNVAPGVHRLSHAYVNLYIVEGEGGLTIVDSGLPRMWPLLGKAVTSLGYGREDVKAVVLTHAHFDHLGMAARAQAELGVPIWAHPRDAYIAAHPYRYRHEKSRLLFALTHPAGLPALASMAAAGALQVQGVSELSLFEDQDDVDVPGRPRIIPSPGHTAGHCALFLPGSKVLFSGDALVTLDPYTGRRGARIVAGAATADSTEALASLQRLAETGAEVVLPGHGEPWLGSITDAAEEALRNGPA